MDASVGHILLTRHTERIYCTDSGCFQQSHGMRASDGRCWGRHGRKGKCAYLSVLSSFRSVMVMLSILVSTAGASDAERIYGVDLGRSWFSGLCAAAARCRRRQRGQAQGSSVARCINWDVC